ncbi:SA1320 family protein [Psychrobacillus sp. FSL H8-0487]|uniref:SA1320 family protein n=1 Tax=Psychrobacillus sp. FSL H8-0487 TaxID=2921391 RepID=UPI0030FB5008
MTTIKNVSNTNDKDLVELAGYHAYRHYLVYQSIQVNGKKFDVIDTRYDSSSGLDALTIQNFETKELSIVFVGSEQLDKDWLETNTTLIGKVPPQQILDAKTYYQQMHDKYGPISSVSGNSLAGALTNAVAMENPKVKAVTLNPAILPFGMVDSSKEYPNITNYYSKYDFLTGTEESLGLGDRIPGNKYGINNGVPLFSMLGSNHTGYVEADENGEFKIEVGIKGQPGHGFIYIGADDHIVTSLWTGSPLYGGQTEKIVLNKENMLLLSNGIRDQVKGRITNVQSYLNNSVSIVLDESMQFSNRVTVLQQTFQTMFDEAAGDPLYNGISNTGTILKGCIDYLISLLDSAESKCRILNSILNSKPAEIIEFITSINIDVESLFAPAREYLNQLKDDVDNLVNGAQIIIQTHIPELFKGGKDMFVDAIVGELNAHYSIVHKNKEAVHNQLTNYETQVKDIATSMFNKDQNLGGSIQSGKSLADGVDTIQKTEIMNIDTSPYLTIGMKIKEIQVELAHKQITSLVTTIVHPIVDRIYTVALMIESAVSAIIFSVKAALNVGLYGNPISLLISIFTDYEEKVKAAVNNALVPLEEIETIAETVRMGSGSLSANLPEMLQNFMPYLDTAIFEPGKFDDVRLYNISTLAILDEMELLFNDIIFQLSGEKAKAIEATLEISKNVLNNIQLLKEQVNRGTL